MLGDLKHPRLIIAKGLLFLLLGILASSIIVFRHPHLVTVLLLTIAIWACCRFYYFAFYVIEHYIDRDYQFDGLYSAFRHILSPNNRRKRSELE